MSIFLYNTIEFQKFVFTFFRIFMERYRRVSKNRPLDPNKPRPEVKLDAKRSRLFSNVLEDIENEATSSGTTLSSSLIKISTLIIMIEFYILNVQLAFIRKFVLA